MLLYHLFLYTLALMIAMCNNIIIMHAKIPVV